LIVRSAECGINAKAPRGNGTFAELVSSIKFLS
jgi:hypothetical protein